MRLHYFCADCAERLPHGEPVARPMPEAVKNCCYCSGVAVMRAKTLAMAACPAGHIAPNEFNRILARAWEASKKDAGAK